MKMANLDHCFDSMFTNPKDSQGVSGLEEPIRALTRSVGSRGAGPRKQMARPTDVSPRSRYAETSDEGPRGRAPVLR